MKNKLDINKVLSAFKPGAFKVNGYDMGEVVASLSGELAALREELASAKADKEAYAQNAIDLRASLGKANALHGAVIQGGKLVAERLTAADQRNGELEGLLRDALGYYDDGIDCECSTEAKLLDALRAVLKPAESGEIQ